MTGHEEELKTVVDLGNALKDVVDVGMYLIAKIHPAGAAILAVAYTVKNLISQYGPKQDSPVVKELKSLRTKMDSLLDRMSNHFTAFKAFYVENQFWNDVPLQTSVLFLYMEDVKTNPKTDNLKNFQALYEKTDPVKLARKLNYQLKRELMNPLMHALDADPLMTTKTFQMWEGLIESVFMQLWEIEINAGVWIHGLQVKKVEEMRKVVQIQKEIDRYRAHIKKWDDEYSKNAAYWPKKVRECIEDVLDNQQRFSNRIKAEMIARDLEFIHTKAIFYVVVFKNTVAFLKHKNAEDQVVVVENHHGCTAVVYRSLHAYKQPKNVVRRAGNISGLLRIPEVYLRGSTWLRQGHIGSWAKTNFKSCGLLLAVHEGYDIGVKWTKQELHAQGPGGYGVCAIERNGADGINYNDRFMLVAGYQ